MIGYAVLAMPSDELAILSGKPQSQLLIEDSVYSSGATHTSLSVFLSSRALLCFLRDIWLSLCFQYCAVLSLG